jgi:hypothetical protein
MSTEPSSDFLDLGELSNWLAQQTVNLSRKPWGFESLLSHQKMLAYQWMLISSMPVAVSLKRWFESNRQYKKDQKLKRYIATAC